MSLIQLHKMTPIIYRRNETARRTLWRRNAGWLYGVCSYNASWKTSFCISKRQSF